MQVQVKLFAAARDRLGAEEAIVELPLATPTIRDVREALSQQHPDLRPILAQASFALDHQYATDDAPVTEEMEIACIPPVSGG